jgi:hypothetical protein
LQGAIDRGLKQNLGVLLSNADIRAARGQRWQQLSALLPHVDAAPYLTASQINLGELGLGSFGGLQIPASVGPFSYFDSRFAVTQTLFDWKAISAARAARQISQEAFSRQRGFRIAANGVIVALLHLQDQLDSPLRSSRFFRELDGADRTDWNTVNLNWRTHGQACCLWDVDAQLVFRNEKTG